MEVGYWMEIGSIGIDWGHCTAALLTAHSHGAITMTYEKNEENISIGLKCEVRGRCESLRRSVQAAEIG